MGSYSKDCEDVIRWVISHPWRSQRHPDPDLRQLDLLVQKLDHQGASDNDLVFYDYLSLYQNDLANDRLWALKKAGKDSPGPGTDGMRSKAEEDKFVMSLKGVNILYMASCCKVLIVAEPPSDGEERGDIIEGFEANTRMYIKRGLCFFEISVSHVFDTIANNSDPDVQKLIDGLPEDPVEFKLIVDSQCTFTSKGDYEEVSSMFSGMYQESPKAMQLFAGISAREVSVDAQLRTLQVHPVRSLRSHPAFFRCSLTLSDDVEMVYQDDVIRRAKRGLKQLVQVLKIDQLDSDQVAITRVLEREPGDWMTVEMFVLSPELAGLSRLLEHSPAPSGTDFTTTSTSVTRGPSISVRPPTPRQTSSRRPTRPQLDTVVNHHRLEMSHQRMV